MVSVVLGCSLLLERERVGMRQLTNCSERGIFLSFILWTPAWAEPRRAAAAVRRAPFMMGDDEIPRSEYVKGYLDGADESRDRQ